MLKKPQFRDLPFETQVFGRYARVEKGTGERYRRIVLAGYLDPEGSGDRCSSRIEQLSRASVSQMAKDLDEQVRGFLQRPIEQAIPSMSMLRTTRYEKVPHTSARRS